MVDDCTYRFSGLRGTGTQKGTGIEKKVPGSIFLDMYVTHATGISLTLPSFDAGEPFAHVMPPISTSSVSQERTYK